MGATLFFITALTIQNQAPELSYQITVSAGAHDRRQTPVAAKVLVPAGWADKAQVTLLGADGKKLAAQLTPPALLEKETAPNGMSHKVVWFIMPKMAARTSTTLQAKIAPGPADDSGFVWKDNPGKYADISMQERPVVRYMYQAYENDPKKRDLNNKPFHHLYDPSGKRLVTKGSGGRYTHHQGLFYGFTRCEFPGGKCNTWYCHEGEYELHKKTLQQLAGPVLARHRTEIDWNDRQGKPFCREVRELAVFAVSGGTLIEWSSQLRSIRGAVSLGGDPQHAGFQFRADNEVAQKPANTYYLRVDGKGKPGQTRNAPSDKRMINLPWNAMSFQLGKARYTAVYVDSPRNPKPAEYSERNYGRFGSWFGKQSLKEDGPPLEIAYRVWLQDGEMTVAEATAMSNDFAVPPMVKVAGK